MLRAFDSPASAMLRIVTANLNGIRSAASKGFYAWLERQSRT